MESYIKTKFLVLSDTRCCGPEKFKVPDVAVDVAIHCGNLTEDTSLKLIVAGNHDFAPDTEAFSRKVKAAHGVLKAPHAGGIEKLYGPLVPADNIIFLDEGTHKFNLQNAFTYRRCQGHRFDIPKEVDVVMAHGPPRGILDRDYINIQAGCDDLYAAMHCFNHIHKDWGAKLAAWRKKPSGRPEKDMVREKSLKIDNLSIILLRRKDLKPIDCLKEARIQELREVCYVKTSHCGTTADDHPVKPGRSTLCVNATITPYQRLEQKQLPWL
ncbi:hypothetical protein QBC36DRAFT_391416 [Triangularia setosa]|uniref:Calcineurin-like phosphoesterase domain-containing protein n=1 Tax=Triangularia setosa TaxID=2587417 RepID=A0AAN6VYK6_9PEZI|nr:hypothetical protein QBC36DRAFT_391416 [Podospora setosa]